MTNIAAFPAGGRLKAADLRDVAPLSAYKSIDQAVTSSTTLVNDNALLLALQASEVYRVDALIYYTGGTHATSDLKVNFTYPSGATSAGVGYLGQTTALAVQQGTVVLGGALAFGSNGTGNVMLAELTFTISVSSTPGTLQLQIAQNTSSATATTVKAGSLLEAVRVQ